VNEKMFISYEGIQLLKQEEGLRLTVYKDVCGLATIGYGHLIKAGENFPTGITAVEAGAILEADITAAEEHVRRDVTIPLNQGEFDALVDFVFNLGDRLPGSTLLRLLNAGQVDAACAELEKWDFAGGKPNAAIQARRVCEMDLWAKGAQG